MKQLKLLNLLWVLMFIAPAYAVTDNLSPTEDTCVKFDNSTGSFGTADELSVKHNGGEFGSGSMQSLFAFDLSNYLDKLDCIQELTFVVNNSYWPSAGHDIYNYELVVQKINGFTFTEDQTNDVIKANYINGANYASGVSVEELGRVTIPPSNIYREIGEFRISILPSALEGLATGNDRLFLALKCHIPNPPDYDQWSDFHIASKELATAAYRPYLAIKIADATTHTFTGTGAWTETARWNTGKVPVSIDEVIINGNATINSNIKIANMTIHSSQTVTINAGKQLTVTNTLENNGTFNLLSDANGTATILTPATLSGSGTANVQQYLSTADSRVWYYVASPVTGATSAVFGAGDKIGNYNETTASYSNPFASATPLEPGRGYVVKLATNNPTYTFSGALNNGAKAINITRTGTTAAKRGFNLIGNPYPSYLEWKSIAEDSNFPNSNVMSTIWTRSYNGTAMHFVTYNATYGITAPEIGETTAHIAPLQAFWVKVRNDNTNATLNLSNNYRSHKGAGYSNLRATTAGSNQILRLSISNSSISDEAVIVFSPDAQDMLGNDDSPKMSNDDPAIPEIYTLAGDERLTVNALSGAAAGRELPVGVKIGTAGAYSISASQINNVSENIILIDNRDSAEFDLSNGESYEFTSNVTDNAERFAIAFRAPQTPTALQNAETGKILAYANGNRIVVVQSKIETRCAASVQIFNTMGQMLVEQQLNNTETVINHRFNTGVYIVKAGNGTAKAIVK
jgi:hypothetical protein